MFEPKMPGMLGSESKRGYDLCAARAGGICEGCKQAAAAQIHHRLHRSHGGNERPSNLLHLCLRCHVRAHQDSDRYDVGLSVKSPGDPAAIPVQHALFGLVLLDDRGEWQPVSGAGADADTEAWEFPISDATKVATDWGVS